MSAKSTRTPEGDAKFFGALENGHSVTRLARRPLTPAAVSIAAHGRCRVRGALGAGDGSRAICSRRRPIAAAATATTSPCSSEAKIEKRKYSDALLLARLKAVRPQHYRERITGCRRAERHVVIRDFAEETMLRLAENKITVDELPPRMQALGRTDGRASGHAPRPDRSPVRVGAAKISAPAWNALVAHACGAPCCLASPRRQGSAAAQRQRSAACGASASIGTSFRRQSRAARFCGTASPRTAARSSTIGRANFIASRNEADMRLKLTNGSVWQVVGSDNFHEALIGGNPAASCSPNTRCRIRAAGNICAPSWPRTTAGPRSPSRRAARITATRCSRWRARNPTGSASG